MTKLSEEAYVESFFKKKSTNTMEAQNFIDYHYLNHANKEKSKIILHKKNFNNSKCVD